MRDRLGIEIRDFENYIQDGVLACQLVNLVQPDLISVNIPEKKRVNIFKINLTHFKIFMFPTQGVIYNTSHFKY